MTRRQTAKQFEAEQQNIPVVGNSPSVESEMVQPRRIMTRRQTLMLSKPQDQPEPETQPQRIMTRRQTLLQTSQTPPVDPMPIIVKRRIRAVGVVSEAATVKDRRRSTVAREQPKVETIKTRRMTITNFGRSSPGMVDAMSKRSTDRQGNLF